jgi:deoxycytidylate deaminase
MTCSQCAALLIQADIGRIVVPDFVEPLRWQESFNKAREMLLEASVKVDRISARGGGISPDEAGIPVEEHSEPNPLDVFST